MEGYQVSVENSSLWNSHFFKRIEILLDFFYNFFMFGGNRINSLLAIFVLIAVNLSLGSQLLRQWQVFREKITPLSVEIIREHPPVNTTTFDIDSDGEGEVVYASSYSFPDKKEFSMLEPLIKDFQEEHYGEILIPVDYFFLDGYYDKAADLYVYRFLDPEKGEIFLREVNNRQYTIKSLRFENLVHETGEIKIGVNSALLTDLNRDGRKEVLVTLGSDDYPLPRGAACYDLESGKMLWHYLSGTKITGILPKDLDGDQNKELILSSFAANDDVEMNGTSDAYSYVIILNHRGEETWKEKVDEWLSSVHLSAEDIDNDKDIEIAASTYYRTPRRLIKGKIVLFDALKGEQEADFSEDGISFALPLVVESKNKESKIYIGDSSGWIWKIKKNQKTRFLKAADSPVVVLKLDMEDSESYYLLTLTRDHLTVFDANFRRKLFSYHFQGDFDLRFRDSNSYLHPLKVRKRNCFLLDADKVYLLRFNEVSPGLFLSHLTGSGLLSSMILVLLFNGFFVIIFKQFLAGFEKRKAQLDASQVMEMIQAITHHSKTPLSTILWCAEKMKRNLKKIKNEKVKANYNLLADTLMDDVGRLKEQTGNMMKLTLDQQVDVQAVATKTVPGNQAKSSAKVPGEKRKT